MNPSSKWQRVKKSEGEGYRSLVLASIAFWLTQGVSKADVKRKSQVCHHKGSSVRVDMAYALLQKWAAHGDNSQTLPQLSLLPLSVKIPCG